MAAMTELSASYDSALVMLSVGIAILSAFVALAVVPRIHDDASSPRRTSFWSLVFGVSLGAGIWTMHFIAMLALKLSVPVRYDVTLTLISLAVGIGFATLGALPLRRGGQISGSRLLGMGTFVGLGIAGMHYTGMAAMRMDATMHFDTGIVALSLLIAVMASMAALWIANHLRTSRIFGELSVKAAAAVVMGLAVSAMHYTGMAAVHFHAQPGMGGPLAGLDAPLMVVALTVIATLVQGGVLVTAALDESQAAMRHELALELRVSSLLEAVPDAVFSINAEGMIQHTNPAASRLFGYAPEEWEGMSVHALAPDDIRSVHPQWVADEMAGRRHDVIGRIREVRGRRRDGSVFPCELSVSQYEAGGAPYFSVVVRDTSERKQAVAEAERLKVAVEQTPEGIFIADSEGRVVYANPAVAAMYGIPAGRLIGMFAAEARGGNKGDAVHNDIFSSLNRGQLWHGDVTFLRPDGSKCVVERSIAPVMEAGEVRYHVCVDTDVTGQRRLQSKMEHTQRLESLGVLAGGIAHDFNNILTAIMGNAALGRLKLDDAHPCLAHMERIEESSQRAAELCKQMLAYSGRGRFVVKPVNISDMVEEITKLLAVSIAKNVVLKFHLTESLPAVDADTTQLQQVIMNLVINASDAIGKKSGVISISTGMMQADADYLEGAYTADDIAPGRFVFLEVADTGCGMDEATRAKMFDPFFTTKFTGRGLGMSAVLGIVRGHHGAIKVYSEKGRGTTFKVLLAASEAEVSEQTENEAWGEWCGVGTVLIVDDEETIRETAAMMLKGMGFDTLTAEDGEKGVEVYRQHQEEIVAVLLDMTMPKMDGKACFRELRRINKDVRVILSSGYNEQDATNRFAGQGLAGFIQKPYTPEALRAKIKEALDRLTEAP